MKATTEPPAPIPLLPPNYAPLGEIVMKCLSKQPDCRFQSCSELGDAIDHLACEAVERLENLRKRNKVIPRELVLKAAAAVAVVAISAAMAMSLYSRSVSFFDDLQMTLDEGYHSGAAPVKDYIRPATQLSLDQSTLNKSTHYLDAVIGKFERLYGTSIPSKLDKNFPAYYSAVRLEARMYSEPGPAHSAAKAESLFAKLARYHDLPSNHYDSSTARFDAARQRLEMGDVKTASQLIGDAGEKIVDSEGTVDFDASEALAVKVGIARKTNDVAAFRNYLPRMQLAVYGLAGPHGDPAYSEHDSGRTAIRLADDARDFLTEKKEQPQIALDAAFWSVEIAQSLIKEKEAWPSDCARFRNDLFALANLISPSIPKDQFAVMEQQFRSLCGLLRDKPVYKDALLALGEKLEANSTSDSAVRSEMAALRSGQ